MSRLRAETMPTVTVPPRPNGLPIAITQSPMRITSELPNFTAVELVRLGIDLQHGDVGLGVGADQFGLELGAVGEIDLDLVGVGDDVVVGDDDALLGIDDEARAERLHLAVAAILALPRSLKKSSKKSWKGEPSGSCGSGTLSGPCSVPLTVCEVEMLTTASSRPAARSATEAGPCGCIAAGGCVGAGRRGSIRLHLRQCRRHRVSGKEERCCRRDQRLARRGPNELACHVSASRRV